MFPYSDKDKTMHLCRKYNNEGHIWCTKINREKYSKICLGCSHNPDIKKEIKIYGENEE